MDTPRYTEYNYKVTRLIRTIDGDTYIMAMQLDIGFYCIIEWAGRVRLLGADTWEMDQAGGPDAEKFVHNWLQDAIDAGTLMGHTDGTDHFGRWLIDLWNTRTDTHLTQLVQDQGLCKPAKKPKKGTP